MTLPGGWWLAPVGETAAMVAHVHVAGMSARDVDGTVGLAARRMPPVVPIHHITASLDVTMATTCKQTRASRKHNPLHISPDSEWKPQCCSCCFKNNGVTFPVCGDSMGKFYLPLAILWEIPLSW